jgi:hypothetical protein
LTRPAFLAARTAITHRFTLRQREHRVGTLEFCFGTSPIQAEKSRPDRKALGSAMLATKAVASAGPTPGIASSRRLISFDRCQAMI